MPKERSRLFVKSLLAGYNGLLGRLAPDGDRVFFRASDFAWPIELEGQWAPIRAELDAILVDYEKLPSLHEVEPGQDDISTDRWKALVLRMYGRDVPENCERFPKTMEILKRIPQATTAMFSILGPGAVVPPHRGPFKGVLRCQLALRVPTCEGRCEIRVADETRSWEEGRVLLFDDTFEHEVRNETTEPRVILFLDFLRPLPWPSSSLN